MGQFVALAKGADGSLFRLRNNRRDALGLQAEPPQPRPHETPSFFCRLVEDVVYWKSSFLSG